MCPRWGDWSRGFIVYPQSLGQIPACGQPKMYSFRSSGRMTIRGGCPPFEYAGHILTIKGIGRPKTLALEQDTRKMRRRCKSEAILMQAKMPHLPRETQS